MSTAADRARTARRRKKGGLAVLPVECDLSDLVETLILAGDLPKRFSNGNEIRSWSEKERTEIADALSRMIKRWTEA